MMDMGSARLGIIVADRLRRNRNMTSTTRMMARKRLNFTSLTDCWMEMDLSYSVVRYIAGGMMARKRGSNLLTAFTISIVLVPGWRCTARMMPGMVLIQLAILVSCTLSYTFPTSSRRTGEPFL